MASLQIGEMNQKITFQNNSGAADGYGGTQLTWSNIATTPAAWASVKPVKQSEVERQGAQRASRIYSFVTWRRDDVTESMRILWGSEICNIREIRKYPTNVFPDGLYMTIEAEAGVTQ